MVLRSVPAPPPLGFELLGLVMCLPAVFALGGYLQGRGRALPLSWLVRNRGELAWRPSLGPRDLFSPQLG